jgi:MFS family permease
MQRSRGLRCRNVILRDVFFGWKVVGAAFLAALFAYGTGLYGPTVFLHVLQKLHGWTIGTISAAVTVHFLVSAAVVSRLAEAHHRYGVAAVTRCGTALLCLGLLIWGWAQAPWQLFGAAMLSGAGYATMSGAGIIAMVSPWFERMRPMALSHAFNGASLSGIVFVPLWTLLIARLGLGAATAIVSATMLVVLWPLAGRFLRPTPRAMGLAPDGTAMPVAAIEADRAPRPYRTLIDDRRFITLSATFALGSFAQIGLVTHLVARLAPEIGDGLAAASVSLATICAIAGRLSLAAAMGPADRRVLTSINFAVQAGGAALLAFGSSLIALLAGCILLGLGVGNLVSLPPMIAQVEFGRADIPRIMSLVTAVNQAVLAFAPGIIGALHDAAGGYVLPFALAAIIQSLAAVAILLGRRVLEMRG